MKNKRIRDLVQIAIVAAVYVALTLVTYPLSYGSPQFRLSECLVLLAFFNKKHGIGVSFGVLIANFFNSEFAIIDCVFGTISTIIAVILIANTKRLFIASLYPTITSVLVAIEIYFVTGINFFASAIGVMVPMLIIESLIGYPLFKLLSKNKGFLKAIKCERKELLDEIQSSGINE